MIVRIEKEYVPSKSIETTIIAMPKDDYESYKFYGAMSTLWSTVGSVAWGCLIYIVLILGLPIGWNMFPDTDPDTIVGFWVLAVVTIPMIPFTFAPKVSDSLSSKRENLLKKHGLEYDNWLRRYPRFRVELEKTST